jgi:hypothetical protein
MGRRVFRGRRSLRSCCRDGEAVGQRWVVNCNKCKVCDRYFYFYFFLMSLFE